MIPEAITLLQLSERVVNAIATTPGMANTWVVAETSDVRSSGGHCYLELIQKDDAGKIQARMRANVWASTFARLNARFRGATGQPFASDLRVMVRVTVGYHPAYGLSANITDINPEYTLGDLLRRRQMMIERLTAEGIINANRSLPWPAVPRRVAVISARGAAGYGDFIDQLYNNPRRLRFFTRLFPAVLQGENAAPSIIAALAAVAVQVQRYDCVVIIRGGGATGDLAAFDNYDLASAIARFPLPVVIGIGHERDITLLDYVANMRVKTPTAAAEWLVSRGAAALNNLERLASDIMAAAGSATAGARRRLDFFAGQLPPLADAVIRRSREAVGPAVETLLTSTVAAVITRQKDKLKALGDLADTLSPEATLRRGFSITRAGGRPVTDAAVLSLGTVIVTSLARGEVTSTVN